MGLFFLSIFQGILQILIWLIIAQAILSWLLAFNVVNHRNPFVFRVMRVLDGITNPVLWPFRKVIPPIGGIDITPVIAILVISAAQVYLLPWIFAPIVSTLGG